MKKEIIVTAKSVEEATAKAAEELFGRPCDRIAVYSTHAAELFDIKPRPLVIPEKI